MSPTFLIKLLCYTCRPFTNKLASPACIRGDDASLLVKSLHV